MQTVTTRNSNLGLGEVHYYAPDMNFGSCGGMCAAQTGATLACRQNVVDVFRERRVE